MTKQEIHDLAKEVVDDWETWMLTPNINLGGMRPEDLIGTDLEQVMVDLLNSVKYGMFS